MKKSTTIWLVVIIAILLIIIIAVALNWKSIKKSLKGDGVGGNGLFNFGTGTGTGNPDVPVDNVSPALIGKKVYAKESNTKIRSSANVDDGWFKNNILCSLEPNWEPAPTVEGIVKDQEGAPYNWYKVKLSKIMGTMCEQGGQQKDFYGYMREDVVTLK